MYQSTPSPSPSGSALFSYWLPPSPSRGAVASPGSNGVGDDRPRPSPADLQHADEYAALGEHGLTGEEKDLFSYWLPPSPSRRMSTGGRGKGEKGPRSAEARPSPASVHLSSVGDEGLDGNASDPIEKAGLKKDLFGHWLPPSPSRRMLASQKGQKDDLRPSPIATDWRYDGENDAENSANEVAELCRVEHPGQTVLQHNDVANVSARPAPTPAVKPQKPKTPRTLPKSFSLKKARQKQKQSLGRGSRRNQTLLVSRDDPFETAKRVLREDAMAHLRKKQLQSSKPFHSPSNDDTESVKRLLARAASLSPQLARPSYADPAHDVDKSSDSAEDAPRNRYATWPDAQSDEDIPREHEGTVASSFISEDETLLVSEEESSIGWKSGSSAKGGSESDGEGNALVADESEESLDEMLAADMLDGLVEAAEELEKTNSSMELGAEVGGDLSAYSQEGDEVVDDGSTHAVPEEVAEAVWKVQDALSISSVQDSIDSLELATLLDYYHVLQGQNVDEQIARYSMIRDGYHSAAGESPGCSCEKTNGCQC
ncbi:hypothetical protein ACHAXT_008748 [Thalassiosira profunda]